MAKGVAAITMDEEYQQKRREAMNKQPSSFKDGLTRGGKGLVSVRTAGPGGGEPGWRAAHIRVFAFN